MHRPAGGDRAVSAVGGPVGPVPATPRDTGGSGVGDHSRGAHAARPRRPGTVEESGGCLAKKRNSF
eukprot:8365000-Pyramimonas_sp.AAC.1